MLHTVNGTTLWVSDKGAGEPTLVFLHYWGGTHRTWQKVLNVLSGSFRTITYDARGWGRSGPGNNYSLATLADDAQALITALGPKSYLLVGHSMGGKVAQLLASRRPAGLSGLILVAPAAPTPTHFPPEALEQQLHAYDNRDNVLQAIDFLTAHPPAPDVLEELVEDSLSALSLEARLAWPTQGLLQDISADLKQIEVPTLVLAGEKDRLDPVEQHREEILSRIHNSRLELIPGAGHLLPIDDPDSLAHAIGGFIGKLKPHRRL